MWKTVWKHYVDKLSVWYFVISIKILISVFKQFHHSNCNLVDRNKILFSLCYLFLSFGAMIISINVENLKVCYDSTWSFNLNGTQSFLFEHNTRINRIKKQIENNLLVNWSICLRKKKRIQANVMSN